MNSKEVLSYTILFCLGAAFIGVIYGVMHLEDWKMREIRKRAEERAEEQCRLLAEQHALSLRKGQKTLQESNDELYKLMHSGKANDAITNTFTALEKSGGLSEKEKHNILDKYVKISRRIETRKATGEDLINYRYSLYTLRNKLLKDPENYKTELGKLNDLIADVDELEAKRNKQFETDGVGMTIIGELRSVIFVPSKSRAYLQELRKIEPEKY